MMISAIQACTSRFSEGASERCCLAQLIDKITAFLDSIWSKIKECLVGRPISILQNLPNIQGNGAYGNFDLFTRWFFDAPNILRNSARFHLGKLPETDRIPFLNRLKALDPDAVREVYVTALKILVNYPLFINYQHQPEFQKFFKAYRVPHGTPGDQERHTFRELLVCNGSLFQHEVFAGQEGALANHLTSDEKAQFLLLNAKDVTANTPAARQTSEKVRSYIRLLNEIGEHIVLTNPSIHNELLASLK